MDDSDWPIRLLSLDSGEARGLAQLFVLRDLMTRVNRTRRKRSQLDPWQLFHLIAGSSTGGLIALMLGRLHMSVDECIAAYMNISKAACESNEWKENAFMRTQDRATPGEQIIQDIVRKQRASNPTLNGSMRDPDLPCKVFVVSSQANTGKPVLLRSYDSPQYPSPTIDCEVWDAARATTARANVFEHLEVEAKGLIAEPGTPSRHNPVNNVYDEARMLWPGREIVLVSIGAGTAPRQKFRGRLGASIEAVTRISADAEAIAHAFELQQAAKSAKTSLYRFSADNLKEVGLEEYDAVADVEAAIQSYLGGVGVQDRLGHCAADLSKIMYEDLESPTAEQLDLQRGCGFEIREFAEWLSPINMSTIQNENIAKVQEGTGNCLLEGGKYRSWLHGKLNILFCAGYAGSGKTVLASQVIDSLRGLGHRDTPVLYYFAESGTHKAEVQSSASILANFLKQLIIRNGNISDQTRKAFERRIMGGNSPTAEELFACLKRETTGMPKVSVVIDALDQLAKSCRHELLGHLFQLQESCVMSLMATSRPSPGPDSIFDQQLCGFRYLGISQTQEDIEAFFFGQMHRLPGVVMRDTGLQHYLITKITELSNGVFLVAKLISESLMGERTVQGIKPTLSSLHLDIHGLYVPILKRVEEQDPFSRDLALKALSWLSYAQRPLTASELQHALAVEADKGSPGVEDLVDVKDLTSVCGGFSTGSKIVTLIHTSAGEYLRDRWKARTATCQAALAFTCLTYLCLDCFADGGCASDEAIQQRLKKYPFLDYASHFWGSHLQAVFPGELAEQALKLLTDDKKISSCSQIMLLAYRHTKYSTQTSLERISALHLLAYFNIEWLAKVLLEQDSDICARDSWGRDPLAWAVKHNHLSMTRLLLDSGADMELKDNQGRTHLALAAMNGCRDIADGLLIRGADPSVRDCFGRTALSLAAMCGHLSVVKLLLGIPNSEADSRDDGGRKALFWAASQGRDDIVAYLATQPSVDINAQNNVGATPLMAAVERDRTEVVEILLKQENILANLKDVLNRTAIMKASVGGHLEVLQLLLAREDAIEALNSVDYSGKSPLDWAIIANDVPVQELFSSRMKVEAMDGERTTGGPVVEG